MNLELIKLKNKYKEIIEHYEEKILDPDSLDSKDIEMLKNELKELSNILYSIKNISKQTLSKLSIQKTKKENPSDLKNKESLAYNEIMISQGKSAKALLNLEKKAKRGDVESQYLIGKTFFHGVIGQYGEIKMKDIPLGLKWLNIAYKSKHMDSGYLIAMYEKSVYNTKNAIKIFDNLAQQDHIDSIKELINIYKNDPDYIDNKKVLELNMKLNKLIKS